MEDICDICKDIQETVFKNQQAKKTQSKKESEKADRELKNLQLLTAASIGHVKCVEVLLSMGADVNAMEKQFNYQNQLRITVIAGIDILPRDGILRVPALMYAAENGHVKCMDLLLRSGADANKNIKGKTALGVAASCGHIKCVNLLINSGVDVNMSRNNDITILGKAVMSRNLNCIKAVVEAGAHVNTAFYNVDVYKNVSTAVVDAAEMGWEEGTRYLLQKGANVNQGHFQVRHQGQAKTKGQVEPEGQTKTESQNSRSQVQTKSQTNIEGETGVRGQGQLVNIFALHSVIYSYFGTHRSEKKSKVDTTSVKLLIDAGADVNLKDDFGRTPLLLCCGFSNRHQSGKEYVKCLLEAGADVNAVGNIGRSALMVAGASCYELTQLLVKAGASVNLACDNRQSRVVCGAENRSQNGAGSGPAIREDSRFCTSLLFRAIYGASMEHLKLFLRLGVPINYVDDLGRNALEFSVVYTGYVNALYFDKKHDLKSMQMILLAAGERVRGDKIPDVDSQEQHFEADVPDFILDLDRDLDQDLGLKNMCRRAIRKQLIDLDPNLNLFLRVPKLGLPELMNKYLLFDMSINEDSESSGE